MTSTMELVKRIQTIMPAPAEGRRREGECQWPALCFGGPAEAAARDARGEGDEHRPDRPGAGRMVGSGVMESILVLTHTAPSDEVSADNIPALTRGALEAVAVGGPPSPRPPVS